MRPQDAMATSVEMTLTKLLFASVLLAGCTQYMRPGDLTPLNAQVATDQRTVVWQRAIDVLLDEGYVPQVLDSTACYISAKQRDDVEIGSLTNTTVIVMVSPEGRLRLSVSGAGVYASSGGLLDDIKAVQKRLMDEIVKRAGATPAPTNS
ncbi:MAG TPA: hypothetical protein VGG28_30035 [Kofleriaceae bacterium]|jgi:hypothetical protein